MRIRRPAMAFLAGAVLITAPLWAACSKGSAATTSTPATRPSSPAKVAIVQPKNGQTVTGSSVHLVVALKGAKIVRPTTTHIVPTEGHLHVFVDGRIVSMNYGLTQTVGGLKPGLHVLKVEFVASDHLPFDPQVFTETTFTVRA